MNAGAILIPLAALLVCSACEKKEPPVTDTPATPQSSGTAAPEGSGATTAGSAGGAAGGANETGTNASPEALAQWSALSADVPRMIGAIESRVTVLGQSKKLPASLDRSSLESARATLESMKSSWAGAVAAHDAGDVAAAVTTARSVSEQGQQVLEQLGMRSAGSPTD